MAVSGDEADNVKMSASPSLKSMEAYMSMERINRKIQQRKEALQKSEEDLRKLEEQAKFHFGELAEKAGLIGLDFSDKEMIAALKEVAARFRGKEKPAAKKAS